MASKKGNKTSFKVGRKLLIWLIIILLFLISFRLIIGLQYSQNRFASNIISEFEKAAKKYNGTVSQSNDLPVWWISQDNLNIINDNSGGVVLRVSGCEVDSDKQKFNQIAGSLGTQVDKIQKKNGFTFNSLNSSKNITDTQFYDYVKAYEKGIIKCVYTADPDCSGAIGATVMAYTFSFTCTDKFDQNYQTQAPYLKDLGIKDAIVHVNKRDGNFVLLNVNYRRSGYAEIAKLVSGKWQEIFSGQDYPPCKVINQNQVPKTIAPDCY